MEEVPDLNRTGARIERLLDELRAAVDPRAYDAVEDLVRALTDLYGADLERIVELAGASCPELLGRLAGDELVAALLVVHGLHPDDVESRVQAALQSVRPFLAHHDGDVELVALDAGLGAVKLRLLGSCDGCPSSSVTLQHAVEQAIHDAAPEIVRIDVDNDLPAAPVRARDRDTGDADAQAAVRRLPHRPPAISRPSMSERSERVIGTARFVQWCTMSRNIGELSGIGMVHQ